MENINLEIIGNDIWLTAKEYRLNLQEAITLRNELTARINEMQKPVAEFLDRRIKDKQNAK